MAQELDKEVATPPLFTAELPQGSELLVDKRHVAVHIKPEFAVC
jgi:hypothetical protein